MVKRKGVWERKSESAWERVSESVSIAWGNGVFMNIIGYFNILYWYSCKFWTQVVFFPKERKFQSCVLIGCDILSIIALEFPLFGEISNLHCNMALVSLTHWGRVTHICVSKLTIIGSDNGLSPERRQAIIWNNAGILLIGLLGTNPSQIGIWIQTFSFKNMHLKVSSAKWRPFCLGLNVLIPNVA